jgi:cell cycle checkpoint control protein RAD9A
MAVLTFTLHPDAVGKFYDAFICLGKFSEAVSFEASKDNVSGCIFTTVTETDTK